MIFITVTYISVFFCTIKIYKQIILRKTIYFPQDQRGLWENLFFSSANQSASPLLLPNARAVYVIFLPLNPQLPRLQHSGNSGRRFKDFGEVFRFPISVIEDLSIEDLSIVSENVYFLKKKQLRLYIIDAVYIKREIIWILIINANFILAVMRINLISQ